MKHDYISYLKETGSVVQIKVYHIKGHPETHNPQDSLNKLFRTGA